MADKAAGSEAHTRLVKSVLVAIGSGYPCRVWHNNTGVGRSLYGDRVIHFGFPGSPDIIGLTSDGVFLGLEIKTGKGIQTSIQIKFQKMIEKFGGRYFVIRSVEQAITTMEEICQKK